MAKRPRKPRLDRYEAYRQASGWYLAAWRDYKGLTLEDVAAKLETSKGLVSDLETGAPKANGKPAQRYNRDRMDQLTELFGIREGALINVNPWVSEAISEEHGIPKEAALAWAKIPEEKREDAVNIWKALAEK